MKRSTLTAIGIAAAASLALGGCADDSPPAESDEPTAEATEPVTLTMSGWALDTTPEFQTIADAYQAEFPNVTIEIKEYADGNDYDTQIIPDLAAGTAPDLLVLKNINRLYTFQSGGQLLDVSDVASELSDEVSGVAAYEIDGKTWAIPYRQDSWVLYYNKALFDAAGVEYPDGSWTWDDYAEAAKQLASDTSMGTYQHSWQSIVQGFANAQSPDADFLGGSYGYLKEYYDRALDLQNAGAQQSFGNISTSSLTYQGEFGKQRAAMLPMGTWYVATLLTQQANGEADTFEWGIAPIPQYDESTTGMDNVPVTFGDPTGIGINPAIDEAKTEAAKDFLAWVAGEGGAMALAGLGVTPALANEAVTEKFFSLEGLPTDDLSKWAFETHDTRPENTSAAENSVIQGILNDFHSEVMSGSIGVEEGIANAEARVAAEAGIS